jgi:hypothetical protein
MRPLVVRWRPVWWLVPIGLALALPATVVWAAALAATAGLGNPLGALDAAAVPLATRRALFLALTLAAPAAAAACGGLGVLGGELAVGGNEVTARMVLPRPPLRPTHVGGLLTLLAGLGMSAAVAGHLLADCLLGGDCG